MNYELKPHLSLLYATLPPDVKRQLAADISVPANITFRTVQVVDTGMKTQSREGVERWRVVSRFRLPG